MKNKEISGLKKFCFCSFNSKNHILNIFSAKNTDFQSNLKMKDLDSSLRSAGSIRIEISEIKDKSQNMESKRDLWKHREGFFSFENAVKGAQFCKREDRRLIFAWGNRKTASPSGIYQDNFVSGEILRRHAGLSALKSGLHIIGGIKYGVYCFGLISVERKVLNILIDIEAKNPFIHKMFF